MTESKSPSLSHLGDVITEKAKVDALFTKLKKEYEDLEKSTQVTLPSDVDVKKKYGFSLMVTGSKKAGKSTLLNTIIGCDLFPAKDGACTFHMNILIYGEEFKLIESTGIYGDNEEATIVEDVDSLRELLFARIPDMDKRDASTPSVFHITAPIPMLKELDMRIIDSPGLNELKTLDATVQDMLPSIDILFYTIDVTRNIKTEDYAFLDMIKIGEDLTEQKYLIDSNKLVIVGTHIDQLPHATFKNNKISITPQYKNTKHTCNKQLSIYTKNIFLVSSSEAKNNCPFWKSFITGLKNIFLKNMLSEYNTKLRQHLTNVEMMLQVLFNETLRKDATSTFILDGIKDKVSIERINVLSNFIRTNIDREKQALADKVNTIIQSKEISVKNEKVDEKVTDLLKKTVIEEVKKVLMLVIKSCISEITENYMDDPLDELTDILSNAFKSPEKNNLLKSGLLGKGGDFLNLLALLLTNDSTEKDLLERRDIVGLVMYILENVEEFEIAKAITVNSYAQFLLMNKMKLIKVAEFGKYVQEKTFTVHHAKEISDRLLDIWFRSQNVLCDILRKLKPNDTLPTQTIVYSNVNKYHLYHYAKCYTQYFSPDVAKFEIYDNEVKIFVLLPKQVETVDVKLNQYGEADRKRIIRQIKKMQFILHDLGFGIKQGADLSHFYLIDKILIAQLYQCIEIENPPFSFSALSEIHNDLLTKFLEKLFPRNMIEQIKKELEFVEKY